MGWVNAAYSLAQMISSIIYGYWSDCRPSIQPILFSLVFLGLGSGLYAYAEVFSAQGIYAILAARILLGFSAGKQTLLSKKMTTRRNMRLAVFNFIMAFLLGSTRPSQRPVILLGKLVRHVY